MAKRLGEPIYVFGNDVKDYFNHLINDVSELALMQIVWVGADDFDPVAMRVDHDRAGNHLVFVVEHRMGFGIHVVTVTAVWVNSCVAIPTQFDYDRRY